MPGAGADKLPDYRLQRHGFYTKKSKIIVEKERKLVFYFDIFYVII